MSKSEKIRTGFLLLIILLLLSVILSSNRPNPVKNNANVLDDYKPFMYYNAKTGKMYAKGYDHFTYGLDSCIHEINVAKGENEFYFVLYDMSIEFKIVKYDY